jgi:uncharacterized protein YceH (UPF0502 family)
MSIRPLSPVEARVLATLMEKARTVPDSYPLTLNMVVTGCNQKTARDPIMQIDDEQAQLALDALKGLSLVFETSGGRVTRFEHNFQRVFHVPEQSGRRAGPADAAWSADRRRAAHQHRALVQVCRHFLGRGIPGRASGPLEEKGGPLVVKLPRAPGAREQRWAHLVCGPVDMALAATSYEAHMPGVGELSHLQGRMDSLEHEVAQLRETVEKLCSELGLSQGGQP